MHLDFIRTLYESSTAEFGTKYVSVYLDVTPTTESAATEVELRWRAARERLAAAGADDATLEAVDAAATGREHGIRGRVIFAQSGAVRLAGTLPWPPSQQIVSLAALPYVMPWLAQLPVRVPHVRVAATRVGGQVVAVPDVDPVTGAGASDRTTTVEGESWPVHKARGGGWSQQRFQRSVEETWAATAKRIVQAAVAEAGRVRAEFVIVGGDIRERSIVLDQLPPAVREMAVVVDREIPVDGVPFEEDAQAEEERLAGQRRRALLDELGARLGGSSAGERRAVTGLAGTFAALQEGLASDVLVMGEPSWEERDVWIGPGLADAATDPGVLRQFGVDSPVQARADSSLARAVAGTGVDLHFLPADDAAGGAAGAVEDGIAALLRAPAAAVTPDRPS